MSILRAKCAECRVPIKGPADPKAEDVFACPDCGASDSHENIVRELGEYAAEKAAERISARWRDIARKSKLVKLTEQPRQHKIYRFVIDLDFH
jgi:hypothetical protein